MNRGLVMKRYVYENNINLIKFLYASDFWTTLKENAKYYKQELKRDNSLRKLQSLIDVIYVDPDAVDKALVAEMQEIQYINNPYHLSINNQKCSLDAIIGWKPLFQYHKGQEIWLKAYEQKSTRDWLLSFGTFNQFIDQMKLNYFVYSNSETPLSYDVIDLSKPYRNSLNHCLEAILQKIKIEENYVTNIIDYIKYFGENLSDTHSELMYKYYL